MLTGRVCLGYNALVRLVLRILKIARLKVPEHCSGFGVMIEFCVKLLKACFFDSCI